MALPTQSVVLNNLGASTINSFDKKIRDSVSNSTLLLKKLLDAKRMFQGGRKIQVPLMYAMADGQSIAGSEVLTITDKEIATAFEFPRAVYESHISISDVERDENSGPSQLFDLVAAKYMSAELKMKNMLGGAALFGDGTVATYGARPLVGLASLVAAANTSGTIGGISRDAGNTYGVNNQVYSALTAASAFASDLTVLQTLWGACSDGIIHPNIIVTNQTIYNLIWARADARQQLGNEEAKKLGMTSIDFNGVPLVADKNCPANVLYMLNTDYLYMKVSSGMDMKVGPFLRPANQLAEVKFFTWSGQLVCDNPRYQGVMAFTG